MTLQQVAGGFDVERGELYQVLGIPAEVPRETALKEMEGILPGFEVSMVRDMVASYLGEGDHLITEPAEAGSRPDAVLIPENNEDVQTTSTPLPARAINADHTPVGDGSGTGPPPVPESEILAGSDIKGRHTLQNIADQAQVPLSDLLQALNLPADTDPGTRVRDLVQNGQVAEVRVVQDVVRALQVP